MSAEDRIRHLLRSQPIDHPAFASGTSDLASLDAAALGRLQADAIRVDFEPVGTLADSGNSRFTPRMALAAAVCAIGHASYTLRDGQGGRFRAGATAPVFDRLSAAEALTALAQVFELRAEAASPGDETADRLLRGAVEIVAATTEPLDDSGRLPIARMLVFAAGLPLNSLGEPRHRAWQAILMAVVGDGATAALPASARDWLATGVPSLSLAAPSLPTDFHAAELRALHGLAASGRIDDAKAYATVITSWFSTQDGPNEERDEMFCALAVVDALAQTARQAVLDAARHVEAIHAGDIAYRADAAFALKDAHALGRFVRFGLERRDETLHPALDTLLIGCCQAPAATVKTAPSQAATIAIAKEIAERPTVRAWQALKAAEAATRHAGLKKKIATMLRAAGPRLASDPDLLIELADEPSLTRQQLTLVRRSLQLRYRSGHHIALADFEQRLLRHASLGPLMRTLVWTLHRDDGFSTALPGLKGKTIVWTDAQRQAVSTDRVESVGLWHRLQSTQEVVAQWQRRIIDDGIVQPFNQAFREIYSLPENELDDPAGTTRFAGHTVEAGIVAGVARSEGWSVPGWRPMQLDVPGHHVLFDCGRTYPGLRGGVPTQRIVLRTAARAVGPDDEPEHGVPWRGIDPVLRSEILRGADLIVCAAAFSAHLGTFEEAQEQARPAGAAGGGGLPGGMRRSARSIRGSARSRREVLRRLYGEQPPQDDDAPLHPWLDRRHLRVGPIRIHVATGIARRDGRIMVLPPVGVTAPSSVSTLPYADPLLESIVAMVNAIRAGRALVLAG